MKFAKSSRNTQRKEHLENPNHLKLRAISKEINQVWDLLNRMNKTTRKVISPLNLTCRNNKTKTQGNMIYRNN